MFLGNVVYNYSNSLLIRCLDAHESCTMARVVIKRLPTLHIYVEWCAHINIIDVLVALQRVEAAEIYLYQNHSGSV